MGREKKKCKIENCEKFAKSIGDRGGKPYYGNVCGEHRKLRRKEIEVWDMKRPSDSKLHPTMKPVEICARAIMNSSRERDVVLDLFLGSGSTLIAAEKTGRICYGAEIDPKYADVIIKRWEDYTGLKAEKINGEGK